MHYPDMEQIPTYALYGEMGWQEARDWLHWETIQSRSRLHGYRIEPHRHDRLFQLLKLTGGCTEVQLDEVTVNLAPPALVVVPPGVVHGYSFSDDVEGQVITLLDRDLRAVGFDLDGPVVLPSETGSVTNALQALVDESGRLDGAHDLAMQAYLTLLSVALRRVLEGMARRVQVPEPSRRHVQAFRRLVEERFRQTRRLPDYAGALGISATHLNRVCQEIMGVSALAVIEQRIALEARRMLLFSTLPIKQIGAELGYEDPAYFARFFTRMLGRSPAAFRKRHPQA